MEANKPVLILERLNSKLIVETAQNRASNRYTLSGTFTEFNTLNRNNRIYTADKFLPHLENLKAKQKEIGILYGEFDHPDTFDIAAQRISHTIDMINYNEEKQIVEGTIRLLSTYWGKEAKAIVDDECPLFVSSRASGVTESNGTVSLRNLFTYDIVADPGFASARMFKSNNITESLGFNESYNAMVFDMSEDVSANGLYEHNANDLVTKAILEEYSQHLSARIEELKTQISQIVNNGGGNPVVLESKVQELGNSQETLESMNKHINYLKKKNSILVNGYRKLENKIESFNTRVEEMDKTLQSSIKFTEHVAKNLQENITLTEDNVRFTEYVARNAKENIDKTNESIRFIEYVAEHAKANIDQSNANATINDKNMEYLDFIAEKVDGLVDYSGLIAKKLNKRKLNEDIGDDDDEDLEDPVSYLNLGEEDEMPSEETAPEGLPEEGDMPPADETPIDDTAPEVQPPVDDAPIGDVAPEEPVTDFGYGPDQVVRVGDNTGTIIKVNTDGSVIIKVAGSDEEMPVSAGEFSLVDIDDDVDNMEIPSVDTVNNTVEAAKVEKNNVTEPPFFMFMNKNQKFEFNSLPIELKSKIVEHMNNSEYFSNKDVITLISNALNTYMTIEEMLDTYMPEDVKPVWEGFDAEKKEMVLNAARLYNVNNRDKVESFSRTKIFDVSETASAREVATSEVLSENALNSLFRDIDRLES